MPIVLYQLEASPPCRTVLMTIKLLGLDVDIKILNLSLGEHMTPEYLEKNPMHSIPFLEDGDISLADSHVIVTYLVSKYGAKQTEELYPTDLKSRSKVDEKLYFDTSVLFPRLLDVVLSVKLEKAKGPSTNQAAKIEEAYGFLDKYLHKSPYVAADHLTIADVACVATISSMQSFVPIDKKYTKIHEWLSKIQQHDWYQKGNVPGLAAFDKLLKQFMKDNE